MAITELQDGRYRSVRLLGSGGMGDVYLMQDRRVGREVAIKIVRAEGAIFLGDEHSADAMRLFQREARAIAALEHPNILPLYDFGEEVRDGLTLTYMVMPYCPEGSLEGWLRSQNAQAFSPRQVSSLVEQAAEALQYAHEHQVIHLDVKPSNFLLRGNKRNPQHPTLLLADFGIARNFTTVASSSHTIRGTPTSMAPEQWSSKPVFGSDQYALAVMSYELLVGRPPFTGNMQQLMYQHLTVQAPAPSTFNLRLPVALDPVLLRALAKKPEDRFPAVADFASAFAEAASQSTEGTGEGYATMAIHQEDSQPGLGSLASPSGNQQVSAPVATDPRDIQATLAPHTSDPAILPTEAFLPARESEYVRPAPETPGLPARLLAEHNLPTIATFDSVGSITGAPPPVVARKAPTRRSGILIVVSCLVLLGLLAGTAVWYVGHQNGGVSVSSGSRSSSTPAATAKPTTTSVATPTPQPGLYIAGTYNGSMTDTQTTQISVAIAQTQGQGALSGTVTFNSSTAYPLSGKVDLQGNFSFTVQQGAGKTPLYFYGAVQQEVYLHGSFCPSSTNSCAGKTAGYFTVGPKS